MFEYSRIHSNRSSSSRAKFLNVQQAIAEPFGFLGESTVVVDYSAAYRGAGIVDEVELSYETCACVQPDVLISHGRKKDRGREVLGGVTIPELTNVRSESR